MSFKFYTETNLKQTNLGLLPQEWDVVKLGEVDKVLNSDYLQKRGGYMKIKKIDIKNYRNFENISLSFHPDLSFVIGENTLGKTNILDLLDTIFNKRSFFENDFKDPTKAIEIKLKLELDNVEIGIFYDLFSLKENIISVDSGTEINLKISQETQMII